MIEAWRIRDAWDSRRAAYGVFEAWAIRDAWDSLRA